MARLILFSGGVESVAIVHTLSAMEDVLLYVTPPPWMLVFSNSARVPAEILNRKLLECRAPSNLASHQAEWLFPLAASYVKKYGFSEVWYGLHAGEINTQEKSDMYEKAKTAFDAECQGVSISWPLYHLTKREQFALLTDELKRSVVSCRTASNCGYCRKCLELKACQ